MLKHDILRKYIDGLTKEYANSLIVVSKAGQGKTSITIQTLQEMGLKESEHYSYIANYITPRALVDVLDGVNRLKAPQLLIMDDIEDTLKNLQAIGLLKGALWEADGKRRVFWRTTKEDISFEFTGRIIFLLNYLNEKSVIIQALKDRSLYYEMDLTPDEMAEMIFQRAEEREYNNIPKNKRIEIAEYIQKVAKGNSNVSLRLLTKAYNLYLVSPNHWQKLVVEMI